MRRFFRPLYYPNTNNSNYLPLLLEQAYGGPGSIVEDDIRKDCSERVCPSGYAWGWLPDSGNMGHSLKECSAAGTCDRSKGVCRCFEGFAGGDTVGDKFTKVLPLPCK